VKEERIIYTASPRRKLPLKAVVLVLCLALFGGVAVGGTVAYLSDSDAAQNTFTMGEVTLTLNETQAEYKMIPGVPIDKDPSVTVGAESSDCWVFAKLVPDADFADYLVFAPNTADWQQLPTTDGSTLLYMLVDTDAEKTAAYGVLAGSSITHNGITYSWEDDQLLVLPTVTKAMMDAAEGNEPTLTVYAYAIQAAGFSTAQEAWDALQQSFA